MDKEEIYKIIEEANKFNTKFNITHSESYTMVTIATAMLKRCYPLAFQNIQNEILKEKGEDTMGTTQTMSIHAALGELKKLDQRINSKNRSLLLIGAKKKSADKVNSTDYTKEQYVQKVEAELQSHEADVARFSRIKSAVVLSNATTKLMVGDREMTVAEAIETKSTIQYKKDLLARMKSKRREIYSSVEIYNDKVEYNLDNQLASLGVKDKNSAAGENLASFMEQYRNQNAWEVIDPLKLDEKIAALEDEILEFETNVDVALSQSNALTTITIEV